MKYSEKTKIKLQELYYNLDDGQCRRPFESLKLVPPTKQIWRTRKIYCPLAEKNCRGECIIPDVKDICKKAIEKRKKISKIKAILK